MYRSSWCEIDVPAFHRNLSALRAIAGTKMLQVVKANAYGHGLVRMAQEAARAGIDMLGVATIGEADTLLQAGVDTPVLIMCAMDPTEIEYCVKAGVHFLAWRKDHFVTAQAAAKRFGRAPLIHLETDTGMARSGVAVEDLPALLDDIPAGMAEHIVGVSSHFTSADLEELDHSERQLALFHECVGMLEKGGLHPLVHMANSPGTLRLGDSRLGMARMGIAAYGLPPSEYTPLPTQVTPILSWKASVTNVTRLSAGQGVGYAWRYIAERSERVATAAIGYADGFRRYPLGVNSVLVGQGQLAPVVGSVFMDQLLFRVPDEVDCVPGDVIVLLGKLGDACLTADDLALRWGTNSYDVVSGIRDRVPRRYLE